MSLEDEIRSASHARDAAAGAAARKQEQRREEIAALQALIVEFLAAATARGAQARTGVFVRRSGFGLEGRILAMGSLRTLRGRNGAAFYAVTREIDVFGPLEWQPVEDGNPHELAITSSGELLAISIHDYDLPGEIVVDGALTPEGVAPWTWVLRGSMARYLAG